MPVLNEGAALAARLQALQPCVRVAELVVVDGGSRDDTAARVAPLADDDAGGAARRAAQMKIRRCRGCRAHALLFLHADTMLPPGCRRAGGAGAAAPRLGPVDVRD